MSIGEKILDAIELLATKSVERAGYDRTIQAQIISCEDATIGKYRCRYQDAIIQAYAGNTDTSFSKGAYVYILVPGNDMRKEKTILGTTDKLGINYISQAQGDQAYDIIGNNTITSDDIFYLNTNNKNYIYTLYSYDGSSDVSLDIAALNQYLKQSSSLIVGATFKTSIPFERQSRGHYGIAFNLKFFDNASGQQVIRTYIVDEDNMVDNPYRLLQKTRQYEIFDIDGVNFIRVESIQIFNSNFPDATGTITNEKLTSGDIEITALELYGAERMTESEINGVSISFYTPQGTFFSDDVAEANYKTITAQVKIKGKLVSNDQNLSFYWGSENVGVTPSNRYYNKYLGRGWKCLNESNEIAAATESQDAIIEWVPSSDTYIFNLSDATAKDNKIKVAVIYDENVITKEINIQNLGMNIPNLSIQSDSGNKFYYDIGHPTLTCLVNGEEEADYHYYWAYESNTGIIQDLPETIEINSQYDAAVAALDSLRAAVAAGTEFANAVATQISDLEATIKSYDFVQRVKGNKIYDVQINNITNFGTFKCSVYNANNVYLGTTSLTLTNTLEGEGLYSLVINNGTVVFQYDENGVAPNSKSLITPQQIQGLSFTIYDNLGNPIDEDIINDTRNCTFRWEFPIKDSMLVDKNEEGTDSGTDETETYRYYDNIPILIYNIGQKYDIKKQRNQIKLTVNYKNMNLTAETSFTFSKQGEPGTNGTEFVVKLVPNTLMENPPLWPVVTRTGSTYRLNYGRGSYDDETEIGLNVGYQLFKAQLWHGGDLVWEGASTATAALDGYTNPDTVEWSILANKYNTSASDNSAFEVTNAATGMIAYKGDNLNSSASVSYANIIKCSITWEGKTYTGTIPITTAWTQNENYRVDLRDYTGFRYVMYSSDGMSPQYDNSHPFEFICKEKINNIWEDISTVQGSHQISYTFSYNGNTKSLVDGTPINAALFSLINTPGLNANQKNYRPISRYSGECVNAAVTCIYSQNGSVIGRINVPIHFLLNKYGLSNINAWDGNSIQINEDGGYILSPQMGAGVKDGNNNFTGVLMGEVKTSEKNSSDIGLMGYNEGDRTFFLNSENGSALLGKAGNGQIALDPSSNKALLYSSNYWKSYNEDGLPTNYNENNRNNQGLLIDLTTPEIRYGNGKFYVTNNGQLHATEANISGAITATSLSLANNVKIPASSVDGLTEDIEEYADAALNGFINGQYATDIGNLQDQIDGNITTWFYDYEPTLNNVPTSDWTTVNDRVNHLGDLFYDQGTGYCYRFQFTSIADQGNPQLNDFEWVQISDSDIAEALNVANQAQDTADSKRRVFFNTPRPPYDPGDLWTQGESGDILRCETKKEEGQTYDSSDWVKASKYTDDTAVQSLTETYNEFLVGDTAWKSTYGQKVTNIDGRVSSAESNIEQMSDQIVLKVKSTTDGKSTLSAVKLSADGGTGSNLLLTADTVDIAGAALFTSGRLSEDKLDAAYDANGAASTAQSNAKTYANSGIKTSVTLYYASSSTTAPTKPTAHVTTNSASTYSAWNIALPTYSATYPYLYTCTENLTIGGTYTWTAVEQSTYAAAIDAIKATADAAAPKTSAASEQQRIYYRSKVSTKPSGNALPTTWITNTGNVWNDTATVAAATGWTRKVTPIANGTGSTATKYLYLWTCVQKKTVSGTVTYSDILLDDTTTVIDGGNIITGSVTANKMSVEKLSAINADMGAITAGSISKGNNFINFDNSPATMEFKDKSTWASATQGIQWTGSALNIKGAVTATSLDLGSNRIGINNLDASVATAGGRNLLPVFYHYESTNPRTGGGITWTVNKDGSVTATGTATSNTTYFISDYTLITTGIQPIMLDPNKKYIAHATPSGGSTTTYWARIRCTPDGTTPSSSSGSLLNDTGSGVALTAGTKYAVMYLYISSGYTCPSGGITFYPMIEEGTTIHAYESTHNGTSFYISKDGIVGTTPADGATGFTVSSSGVLKASNAIIYGTIYASAGKIGGWTLSNGILSSGTLGSGTSGSYGFWLGTSNLSSSATTIAGASRTDWRLAIGSGFGVTATGAIYSTNGSIGSFKIASNALYSGSSVTDTSDGAITMACADFTKTINGTSVNTLRFAVKNNFGIDKTGKLYAGGADISGKITATSGSFNGTITATGGSFKNGTIDNVTATNLTINSGRVNITTSTSEDDIITLAYGSYSLSINPLSLLIQHTNDSRCFVDKDSLYIALYDSSKKTMYNAVSLYTQNNAGRLSLWGGLDDKTVILQGDTGAITTFGQIISTKATTGGYSNSAFLAVNGTANTDTAFTAYRSDTAKGIQLLVGSGGTNRGLYDVDKGWLLYYNDTNLVLGAPLAATTFAGIPVIQNNGQYPILRFKPSHSTSNGNNTYGPASIFIDSGSTTAIKANRMFFRVYSPTSETATTYTSYYEQFYLPSINIGRTGNAGYSIVTTKVGVDGNIWAGTGTDTIEREVGVNALAGKLYLYSGGSETATHGLYTTAHGTGSAKYVIKIDTNNAITWASGTFDGNIRVSKGNLTLYTETTSTADDGTGIYFSIKDTTTGSTYSSAYLWAYQDHGSEGSYGMNIVLKPGGNLFIGSGEGPSNHYALYKGNTGESTYITADSAVYIQSNANTIANRKGFAVSSNGNFVPVSADAWANGIGNIGTSDYKLAGGYFNSLNMYGTIIMNSGEVRRIQNDTSNYSAIAVWDNKTSYTTTYKPQIGFHNTGETIMLIPYAQDTDPWAYSVGLAIRKTTLLYNNKYVGNFTATPTASQFVYASNATGGLATYPRIRTIGSNRYPLDFTLYNDAGTKVGEMWYDQGSSTNVTSGGWNFRAWSPKSTADTGVTSYYETYSLPIVTTGRTGNAGYSILTSKSAVTVAQGGTGATAAAGARANLGTWALVSDSYDTLMKADGSTNGWIKIGKANTSYGLIPSQTGNAGNGHNYIGTSSWYWKYAYIDEIHGTLVGNATNVTGTVAVANGGTGATSMADAHTTLMTPWGRTIALANGSALTVSWLEAVNGCLVIYRRGSNYGIYALTTWDTTALKIAGGGTALTITKTSGSNTRNATLTNNTGSAIFVTVLGGEVYTA